MSIINGIELDDINITTNKIKQDIKNNSPIEEKLHVIVVISNPCLYKKRYILCKEFIQRIELEETNVELYIVELAYKNQEFIITDNNNKKHLQIRTEIPLWHKENMINLGVKKLLPTDYKAFAWIDADIAFESTTWAIDTLKLLNGSYDILQLFSHCNDMDKKNLTMLISSSAGYQYIKHNRFMNISRNTENNYPHPGYAWAITRTAYEKMGGLYDKAILGSGDNIMMFSIFSCGLRAINNNSSQDYKDTITELQNKIKDFRIGYVPGLIHHYYHGSKKNRKYAERWQILIKYNFSPKLHITYNEEGIIIPTNECPIGMTDEIYQYFTERNEDE